VIIYDESSEAYHANPAIGSGDIRAFLKSPRLFRDHLDGIYPRETKALAFGIASHMAILEPHHFASRCAIKPDGLSFATKEGKAWRDEHEGWIIVGQKDADTIHRIHDRMPREVRDIIAGMGYAEVTVRADVDGINAQCRADWWKGSTVYDLKTIADIDQIERSVIRFGYHVQQEWYQRVIESETGERPKFLFLFAETKPPHRWRIVELDWEYCEIAAKAIDDCMHGLRARLKSGCWDDPEPVHMIASPPPWLSEDEPGTDEDE
jgi:hypothetical protein